VRSGAVAAAVLTTICAGCNGHGSPVAPPPERIATYGDIHIPSSTVNLAPMPRDATVVKLNGREIIVGVQTALTLQEDGGVSEDAFRNGDVVRILGPVVNELSLAIGRSRSLVIVADASTPYELLFSVAMSGVAASYRSTWIAVAHGSEVRAVRVRLPHDCGTPPIEPTTAGIDQEPPLVPMLSLSLDRISLYSLSGAEGTEDRPLLRLARSNTGTFDFQLLGGVAAGIVARHFLSKPRPAQSLLIGILPAPDVPLQLLVDAVTAVSIAPVGKVRFPEPLLTIKVQ
jgi:hypothetical protein